VFLGGFEVRGAEGRRVRECGLIEFNSLVGLRFFSSFHFLLVLDCAFIFFPGSRGRQVWSLVRSEDGPAEVGCGRVQRHAFRRTLRAYIYLRRCRVHRRLGGIICVHQLQEVGSRLTRGARAKDAAADAHV